MMSDLAKGLFHQAILMSGTSFIKTWPFADKKELLYRLAKKLGWDGTGGERKILEILENADAKKIVEKEGELLTDDEMFHEHILFPFTPVIEPYVTTNTFMAEDPEVLSKNAWSNNIDCMFGYNSLEGGMMAIFPGFSHFYDFIQNSPEDENTFDGKLRKFYFGNEPPTNESSHEYFLVRIVLELELNRGYSGLFI
jgi:carboxylesterase type B